MQKQQLHAQARVSSFLESNAMLVSLFWVLDRGWNQAWEEEVSDNLHAHTRKQTEHKWLINALASVKLVPSFLPPSVCKSTKSTGRNWTFEKRLGLITVTRCKLRDFRINHKNYNFLDCDWFKKLLFSPKFTCQVVIGQFVIG